MSAVEETLKRISSHKGVIGTMIINSDGIPIRTTLENDVTVQHAALLTHLTEKARSVIKELEPTNELTFLRVRSMKHEILVAPDNEYLLIVIQQPSAE
eukprot:PRCOL_00001158-RA